MAFDREIFLMQKFGGVAKSFSELISVFNSNPHLDVDPSLTFTRSNNNYLQELNFIELKPQRKFLAASGGLSTLMTLGPIRTTSSLWAGGNPFKNRYDILHATYYRPTLVEELLAKKLVVTIHDFIPELMGWTGVRNPHIGKRRMCQKANKIISVSQSTTELLVNFYGLNLDKIETIHHGVRVKEIEDRKQENRIPDTPSILYVGHRGGYKNFQILAKAIELANARGLCIKLISAGPELTYQERSVHSSILDAGLWEHFTTPDDKLLGDLYLKATVHVVPSFMEGFGMTILESMSYGTPTVLADIPVFHEVAGDNALYFQANSEESLLATLEQMLNSSTYMQYAEKSVSHAEENSWELTAEKYAKVYLDLAS